MFLQKDSNNPPGICLLKVNNKNTRIRYEILFEVNNKDTKMTLMVSL